MTDYVKGFTVTLEKDVRDDVAEHVAKAISMIKGVIKVTPNIVDASDHMNRMRIKREILTSIYETIDQS